MLRRTFLQAAALLAANLGLGITAAKAAEAVTTSRPWKRSEPLPDFTFREVWFETVELSAEWMFGLHQRVRNVKGSRLMISAGGWQRICEDGRIYYRGRLLFGVNRLLSRKASGCGQLCFEDEAYLVPLYGTFSLDDWANIRKTIRIIPAPERKPRIAAR